MGPPVASGVIADSLIQRRADDVMAQHRAVAELENVSSRQRQAAATFPVNPLGRPIGENDAESVVTKDGRVYSAVRPPKGTVSSKPKSAVEVSAAESLAARRAAQAEAERQRILDALRQK